MKDGSVLGPPAQSAEDTGGASTSEDDISLEGTPFDSNSALWRLSDRVELNIRPLMEHFAGELIPGLLGTLRHQACTRSPLTCQFALRVLCDYARHVSPGRLLDAWRVTDLANYRTHLVNQFGHETYLGKVRAFVKSWYALRFPGVNTEVVEALNAMRLKGDDSGRAARRMESDDGPLDPGELQRLIGDLYRAYEQKSITHDRFATTLFHILTGRRPRQSADLKCRDLQDHTRYVCIPRAKQRGGTFRSTFRSIEFSAVHFAVFEHQRALVRAHFELLLDGLAIELPSQDVESLLLDLPLFPAWRRLMPSLQEASDLVKAGQLDKARLLLREHAFGPRWHRKSVSVLEELQHAATASGAKARDGTPLQLDGRRLRHTKGTDLARAGLSPEIISWVMDHTLLSSTRIYIDNLPEHAIPPNTAMSNSVVMQNVAQLFRGRLVDREADAVGGSNPHNRIHVNGRSAATCGSGKLCGLGDGIPKACFTCDDFQPWLDGPHEELLHEVLAERQQHADELGADHPVTTRSDKTIIAIINVIQRCESRRMELERVAPDDSRS